VLWVFTFEVSKFVKQSVKVRAENLWQTDEIFLTLLCYILFLRHSYEKREYKKASAKKVRTKQRKKEEEIGEKEKTVRISRNTVDLCTFVIVFHSNLFLVIPRSLSPPLYLGPTVLIHYLGQQLRRLLGTLIQHCYLLLTYVLQICHTRI
jgi:hypothetical protein